MLCRHSGLANNATLEMVPAVTAAGGSNASASASAKAVDIVVQLPDGARQRAEAAAGDTVWALLRRLDAQDASLQLTTRTTEYFPAAGGDEAKRVKADEPLHCVPTCQYLNSRLGTVAELQSTTFKDLGILSGRALLRVAFQVSDTPLAAVELDPPAPEPEPVANDADPAPQPPQPDSEGAQEAREALERVRAQQLRAAEAARLQQAAEAERRRQEAEAQQMQRLREAQERMRQQMEEEERQRQQQAISEQLDALIQPSGFENFKFPDPPQQKRGAAAAAAAAAAPAAKAAPRAAKPAAEPDLPVLAPERRMQVFSLHGAQTPESIDLPDDVRQTKEEEEEEEKEEGERKKRKRRRRRRGRKQKDTIAGVLTQVLFEILPGLGLGVRGGGATEEE